MFIKILINNEHISTKNVYIKIFSIKTEKTLLFIIHQYY